MHKEWMKILINDIARNGGWVADKSAGFTTATVWVSHRLGTKVWAQTLNVDIKYKVPWNDLETVKELGVKF